MFLRWEAKNNPKTHIFSRHNKTHINFVCLIIIIEKRNTQQPRKPEWIVLAYSLNLIAGAGFEAAQEWITAQRQYQLANTSQGNAADNTHLAEWQHVRSCGIEVNHNILAGIGAELRTLLALLWPNCTQHTAIWRTKFRIVKWYGINKLPFFRSPTAKFIEANRAWANLYTTLKIWI